ncbi:MAG: hypothetical protein ACKVQA_09685 [Burkholderiales bacterium]
MRRSYTRSSARLAHSQRGVVLFLTLIALVVMTLAAIALVRSVDTSNMIAGNLAFQQSTAQSGDSGIETAVAWLEANSAGLTLQNDNLAGGYLASRQDPNPGESWADFWDGTLEPAGLPRTLAANAAGNTVSYVIHRLCATAGNPTSIATGCATGLSKTFVSHDAAVPSPPAQHQVLYRITSRIEGPRNTVSYVQAVVAL